MIEQVSAVNYGDPKFEILFGRQRNVILICSLKV